MKKLIYTVFVLALLTFANAFGQRPFIQLTFTATYGGQVVTLDSIAIHNLTQGGDTTLYSPANVLVLDYITGIRDQTQIRINRFSISPNFPNPFDGKTSFTLNLPEKDRIKISVFDVIGREGANFTDILDAGNHSFDFYAGKEKYYLLTATSSNASQSIKMMNFDNDGHQIKLDYQGRAESAGFKSQKAINSFGYLLGDQLRFIGYSDTPTATGSDVLEDAPQISKTYQFAIFEGVPCPEMPTITDADGNIYNTVQIGEQCWMKENMKVGTMIVGLQNQTDNGIIEKYCFDDDPANCDVYGGLYKWTEMMQYSTNPGIQGICPTSWHLPTDAEWTALTDFLGGEGVAGGKMKTTGTIEQGTGLWYSPNTGATNESGFSGLPGGSRTADGFFYNFGAASVLWSSTEYSTSYAWTRRLHRSFADANRDYYYSNGESLPVRCLRD